jgi:hypothetical protein
MEIVGLQKNLVYLGKLGISSEEKKSKKYLTGVSTLVYAF